MHPAVAPVLGVFGQTGHTLVGPSTLRPPAGLARAQASASVTARGADGTTWSQFAANQPRFAGPAGGLLVEGQRTNGVRNPRGEGALPGTVGSGGALPTNWNVPTTGGLTTEVVSLGQVSGIDLLRLRIRGTANATQYVLAFDASTAIVAAPSQLWTASFFWRLVATPNPPTAYRHWVTGRTSSGGAVTGNTFTQAFVPDATLRRYERTETLTSGTTIARVQQGFRLDLTSGQACDVTIEVGWPQMEQAGFASTPILPALGTPAAGTRSADLVTATLAGLGIGANGACTILWSGVLTQNAGAATPQALFAIDDGTVNNRFAVLNTAGGAAVAGERITATAPSTAALGSMTAGTPFRVGMSLDGAGRAAFSRDGGAVLAVTGGPTSGLTTLRLGNTVTGSPAMFGETRLLRVLPLVVSDQNLPALVAGLPA